MHSARGDTPSRVPGSPIRTPPDQRSVDSSPGPIAASHVLHRLLVPRHPPCALTHLHTRHPPAQAHNLPTARASHTRSTAGGTLQRSEHTNTKKTHYRPPTPTPGASRPPEGSH